MAAPERSAFIYGFNITTLNRSINFVEAATPSIERLAEIEVRDYTLGEFVNAVAVAMNSAGTQEYDVILDRLTQRITISAANNFSLLPVTGAQSQISAFDLMGYDVDLSGSNSYEAPNICGKIYEPQYRLQRYVDFLDDQSSNESRVNTAADGQTVEAVSFGEQQRMSCNIIYATDIINQTAIDNNANGVSDLRDFMNFARNKYKMEFLPDKTNRNFFYDCILDRTPESGDGTRFRLKELYSRGLANYFETGLITFLRVNF
jgi:hypothetical protein